MRRSTCAYDTLAGSAERHSAGQERPTFAFNDVSVFANELLQGANNIEMRSVVHNLCRNMTMCEMAELAKNNTRSIGHMLNFYRANGQKVLG